MESDLVYMKVLSTVVNGGYTDSVTGESFEPSVEVKLCNQSMSKFFTVRISDMPAFPMIVFVSGHEYTRNDVICERYTARHDYETFSKRININCKVLCSEIEMSFPNVSCEIKHTGTLVQADYRTIMDTIIGNRLHHYNYGTLVSLRLSINTSKHVMDVDTYNGVYQFLRDNGPRGLFHVYQTYDVHKYIIDSMRLECNTMARQDTNTKHMEEFKHEPTSYAHGYRTHSIGLYLVVIFFYYSILLFYFIIL